MPVAYGVDFKTKEPHREICGAFFFTKIKNMQKLKRGDQVVIKRPKNPDFVYGGYNALYVGVDATVRDVTSNESLYIVFKHPLSKEQMIYKMANSEVELKKKKLNIPKSILSV